MKVNSPDDSFKLEACILPVASSIKNHKIVVKKIETKYNTN